MRKKLFLVGLLSFFFVNSQLRVTDMPLQGADKAGKEAHKHRAAGLLDAPDNDDCAGAIELTVNSGSNCIATTFGTLVDATDSGVETETGTADDDIWYTFTATSESHRISLDDFDGDDDWDTVIEVFEGGCDGLSLLKSSDPETTTVNGLTPGNVYYVRIFSYTDEPVDTSFEICISVPPPGPANDNCDGAVALTVNPDSGCSATTTGTLESATDSDVEADTGFADDDVWYTFTATSATHKITIEDLESDTFDGYDVVLELFEGGCDGLTLLESVEDYQLTGTNLVEGNVYYVRIFSWYTSPVNTVFELCVGTPPGPPANDECESAVALTVNPDYLCGTVTAGTVESATDSGIEADTGEADDDVWYTFVATGDTHKISLENFDGDDWDMVIEVMDGECGSMEVAESSDPESIIVDGLTAGTTYYVRVFSYYDESTDTSFDICVGTPPNAPANDECANAIPLTVNTGTACTVTTDGTLQSATDSGLDTETGSADDDVWYSFTALAESQVIRLLNVEGEQTTDLVFEVIEGGCDGLTVLQSSDANSAIVEGLTAGTNYLLRVYSYSSDPGADTTFSVCVSAALAPPANDNCDAAVELTVNPDYNCGVVTAGTVAFATDSDVEEETGTADDDVWYSFTATGETHKISLTGLTGSTTDMVIEVFDGGCDGELIVSSDPQSVTIDNLTPGNLYMVRVFSYTSDLADTSFNICVGTLPESVANDDCEGAYPMTVNAGGDCEVVTSGSFAAATDSGIEAEDGDADDDVWFSFVATGTEHKISLVNVEGFDTLAWEIFDGECGSLNYLQNFVQFNGDDSYVDGLTPGTTYYVRVFSYYSDPVDSAFSVCVGTRPAAPANDECPNAIPLTLDTGYCNGINNNGTNSGATDSGVDMAECYNYGENDVWFSFTVPAGVATVDISTDFTGGTLVDTEIALYSGACNNLTELDCSQDDGTTILSNGDSYNSIIEDTEVTVGETYYVRVAGYDEDQEGTFCLQISTNQTLSATDFEKGAFKAYPNPVKDVLTLTNSTPIADAVVTNLLGQVVISKTINANEAKIDMSALSAGAYIVKITADNQVKTIKVVKE